MRDERQSRPDEHGAAKMSMGDKSMVAKPNDTMAARRARSVVTYAEHFAWRVLQDALNEASATYWRRRAEALRAARHREGDYLPDGRLEAARTRWRELTEAARACDNAASFLEAYGNEIFAADVASVMTEGAAA